MQRNPLIPVSAEPIALQAILYFTLARSEGKSRAEAVADFIQSSLCKSFGDNLTVGNVYGFAEAAGYESLEDAPRGRASCGSCRKDGRDER